MLGEERDKRARKKEIDGKAGKEREQIKPTLMRRMKKQKEIMNAEKKDRDEQKIPD